MKKLLALFLFAFLVWAMVTWTFDATTLVVGVLVAGAVAWLLADVELEEAPLLLLPHRLLWALAYVPVLFLYVVQANLDVAYRVLHPALPIRPGIVRVRTELTTDLAKTFLANSITLTPGTLTVDIDGQDFYVHWINIESDDPQEQTETIIRRFERMLKEIFE